MVVKIERRDGKISTFSDRQGVGEPSITNNDTILVVPVLEGRAFNYYPIESLAVWSVDYTKVGDHDD